MGGIFSFSNNPLFANGVDTCRVFSNHEFAENRDLADEKYKKLQKHFGFQLNLKEEEIFVKLYQNGIRDYDRTQIILMAYFVCMNYDLANFEKASILFQHQF